MDKRKFVIITHATDRSLVPMCILGDHEFITNHIWETSKTIWKLDKNLKTEVIDGKFLLDPGGPVFIGHDAINFEMDGVEFSIMPCHIPSILYRIKRAKERIPGYMRFRMWNWLVIISIDFYFGLIQVLEDLELENIGDIVEADDVVRRLGENG